MSCNCVIMNDLQRENSLLIHCTADVSLHPPKVKRRKINATITTLAFLVLRLHTSSTLRSVRFELIHSSLTFAPYWTVFMMHCDISRSFLFTDLMMSADRDLPASAYGTAVTLYCAVEMTPADVSYDGIFTVQWWVFYTCSHY